MYDRFVDFGLNERLLSVVTAVTEVVDLHGNNAKKCKLLNLLKLDLTILVAWMSVVATKLHNL